MKKTYFVIYFLFASFTLFSQNLFLQDVNAKVIATKDPDKSLVLKLNTFFYSQIIYEKNDEYLIDIPFFNEPLELILKKNTIFNEGLKITSKTNTGDKILDINPNLLSYSVFYNNQNIGVLNFFNKEIVGFFKINNIQYEIAKFQNTYVLFDANNSINSSTFSCEVQNELNNPQNYHYNNAESNTPKCIELAIEIDEYTRQTFNNDQETTDWALAILAGVSQIYETEINLAIQVIDITIWNTTDPYSVHSSCSDILNELGNYWQTNNGAIARDLVHFLSKRSLGCGIAWLDALCSTSYGYSVSASLNNDTNFTFPNPTYTWNLNVVTHEIGHNIGSHHTHWCGWAADPTFGFAGGVIDNCVDVEGNCSNNPTPQTGTIMSYCHLTSGGAILEFDDIVVSQALNPGINNSGCITNCDYYGCTDSTAFNFDPNATIDDGTCVPIIFGCIDPAAANYNSTANTDDGSCTYCASITFVVSDITCYNLNDGSIDMSLQLGTPPFTVNWIGPNGFNSVNEDISNLESGNYTVTVSDAFGCTESITLSINNPLPISIDSVITSNVSCYGTSDGFVNVYTSGGTQPYFFNWNGADPNSLVSGSYNVSVTDNNSCPTDSASFTITEPSEIITSVSSSDISCFGQGDGSVSLSVNGGITPYYFSWNGPNAFSNFNQNLFNLEAGIYNVLITDANGCLDSLSTIISEPNTLLANTTVIEPSCNGGTDGSIDISLNGGVFPYTYIWNTGANTQDLLNIGAGFYTLDIYDLNGCFIPTITVTVNEPLPSFVNAQVNSLSCHGDNSGSIDLTYIPANGINQYNYSWNGPNNFSSSLEDINNISSGSYLLTITENSCTITNTFYVSEPDPFNIIEDVNHVSCFDSINGSILLYINGGTPSYTTNWNGINPQSVSAGIYSYTITDNNNCIYTDTVSINQPNPITVNENITNVSCYNGFNGSVSLSISGGTFPFNTSWQNSNPNQLDYGYHYYTVVDFNSCSYSDSVFVDEPNQISVTENLQDALCYGSSTGSASLSISGGIAPYTVDWYGFNNLNLFAGSYLYDVIDFNNCTYSGLVTIQEPNSIITTNTITASTCPDSYDGSIIININGGTPPYQQNWFGNNPLNLQSGTYIYLVVDSNNCVDTNQITVPSTSDISVVSTVNNVSCYDFCDGSIDLAIANGVAPYSINWYGMQSDSLCEGTYSFEIIDNLGCVWHDSVSIFMPQPLTLNISQNGIMLQANVNGGTPLYNYFWWNSSGVLGNTQAINFTAAGYYYCVVSDINNCSSDTVSIYINETSISNSINENISLFPNPFSDYLNIKIPYTYNNLNLILFNVLGETVFSKHYNRSRDLQLDRKGLSAGSYYILLDIDGFLFRKKLIVE